MTSDELIQYMKEKGIKFSIIDENEEDIILLKTLLTN